MNVKRMLSILCLGGALCLLCGCDFMDYQMAKSLLSQGNFEEARAIYTQMEEKGGYKDSAQMLEECDYVEAGAAYDSGDYARASELYKGIRKYKDAAEGKQRADYALGEQHLAAGDYSAAYLAFWALEDYGESPTKLAQCAAALYSGAQVGDIIYFGAYEPEGYKLYSLTPIPWRVLAKNGDYALLLSEYLLEKNQTFSKNSLYWDDSEMRTWLNGYFYENAFTEEEKASIQAMYTEKYWADTFGPSEEELQAIREELSQAGSLEDFLMEFPEGTLDNVFFLSAEEAEGLLSGDEDRTARPIYDPERSLASNWWLRSFDEGKGHGRCAGYVDGDGKIHSAGKSATWSTNSNLGVRPAICIRLSGPAQEEPQDMSLFGYDVNVSYGKREKPSKPSSSSSGSSSGRCPACNGTGTIRFYYGSSDLEAILSGHDPYTLGTCPMCNGRG